MVVMLPTTTATKVAPRSRGLVCQLMFCSLFGSGLPRISQCNRLNRFLGFLFITDSLICVALILIFIICVDQPTINLRFLGSINNTFPL